MKTKLIKLDCEKFSANEINEAVKLLKNEEIVAIPTETVYGLAANAFIEKAVAKIFVAKGRPADNPLIVHISDASQLDELVEKVPLKAKKLIKEFWPGPLTIVLKKSKKVPDIVTAGLDSVAVRMPSNKIALEVIKQCGFPLAAPSANSSTLPSPTKAKHVLDDLNGKIPLILDEGQCEVGLESTVISLIGKIPQILRPGKVTLEEIEQVIGKVNVHNPQNAPALKEKPISPGMKYRHYSPRAEVILISSEKNFEEEVFELSSDKKIGIISFSKKLNLENEYFFDKDLKLFAKNLFICFRELDERGTEIIFVEGVKERGLGLAIMNRLKKASLRII